MSDYVVISKRGGKPSYLGEHGSWWADPKKAHVYPGRRTAELVMNANQSATGVEPLEDALAKG
jgi:hypothetical protein